MPPPLLLTSLDNPRIKRLVQLRKQRERRELGVFVLEGSREVQRAGQAGLDLLEVYLCPAAAGFGFDHVQNSVLAGRSNSPPFFEITPPLLTKISNLEHPEGLLALAKPPVWSWKDLPVRDNDLFIVAAGINKPGNLGAIARTASAVGATALLADAEVDAMNPNAIRASTGAVFTLPILTGTTAELSRELVARLCRIVIATPESATNYTKTDLTGSVAIVIGAEDQGVPIEWRSAATHQVAIPMAAGVVDSLNASNTAAILLFEAMRQRGCKGR